jgi:small subunit ribosomal protein S20
LANHKSAIKRHRQSLRRRARNQSIKTGIRTAIRKVRVAVAGKDGAQAASALEGAVPAIDKAASKGVIHKRAASRKVSRLMKAVHKVTTGAASR